MEPLQILSEAVIDILKEFSAGKRTLTSATLEKAFSAREEVLSLVYPVLDLSENERGQEWSMPGKELARVSLAQSETSTNPNTEPLSELRNAFLKILENLGPVITGVYENQFCELQDKINQCESLVQLSGLGEDIGKMVNDLIDEAAIRMDYSNDFLFELSKDLCKMEEQLFTYQNHNRETHQISSEFHNDLLSHTADMHRAFETGKSQHDLRHLISSKLNTISKAIEIKSQSDEVRMREADAKIDELQNNLKTYNQEILQVRKRADSLEKEVLLDELTQVNNRRAYDLQIRESLRRYQRNGEQFSLILMDIDHFKRVNDEYGHKAGDNCLKEIAKLIKTSLRKSDFLARYGGEELIAILSGSDGGNARKVAEKIRLRIENTRFCYQEKVIPITISSGVTQVLPDDTEPEVPFIRVDEAMYRAKKAGRNTVCEVVDFPLCSISDKN